MSLFTAAPFFLELPTLTIVWFLQCESYFFSFGLFDVFHWKCLKIQPKTEAQKTTGKTCQRAPKIIPKCLQILEFPAQKRQLALKKSCFVDLFFSCFFRYHFFGLFGRFLLHFGPPERKGAAHFLNIFWICFGLFFGFDFFDDFGWFSLPKATENVKKTRKKQA